MVSFPARFKIAIFPGQSTSSALSSSLTRNQGASLAWRNDASLTLRPVLRLLPFLALLITPLPGCLQTGRKITVLVTCTPSSILTTQTSKCSVLVPGYDPTSGVKWSVSPSNIGHISSAGVFTPAGAGTATITAASTVYPNIGSAKVVVTAPIAVTSVSASCVPAPISRTRRRPVRLR